jgi:hypothetical protein
MSLLENLKPKNRLLISTNARLKNTAYHTNQGEAPVQGGGVKVEAPTGTFQAFREVNTLHSRSNGQKPISC